MHIEQQFKELIAEPNAIESICRTALETWNAEFGRANVLDTLDRYVALGGVAESSSLTKTSELEGMYKGLKQLRRAGQYLRSVYFLLDQSHSIPPVLDTFYKSLGRFLDRFWMPNLSQQEIGILQPSVALLQQDAALGDIHPDSLPNIIQHAHTILESVTALANTTQLDAINFHLMRKQLRSFTNIFTLVVKQMPDHASAELKKILVAINDELGEIHDDILQKSLQGEHVYTEQQVHLDPNLRQQLLDLLGNSSSPAAQPVAPPQSPANPIW